LQCMESASWQFLLCSYSLSLDYESTRPGRFLLVTIDQVLAQHGIILR
jgi:hypothetical protein